MQDLIDKNKLKVKVSVGYESIHVHMNDIVPDHGSRIRGVVLVRRIFSSGTPQGVGILEWGGDGERMEMGRSVYEQPGTKVDRILSHQGGFPSK